MSTTECEFVLAPSFTYHIIDGNAPNIYVAFWIIAAISMLSTIIIVTPTLYQLLRRAIAIRDMRNDILIPSSYRIAIIILIFPLIAVCCNFVILLAPITATALNFLISLYGSITLVLFTGLVAQYLGLNRSASKSEDTSSFQSWQEHAPPSKFYGVPPCGCCFKPCITERKITVQDFRRLSMFVFQFVAIGPLVVFLQMFPGITRTDHGYITCIVIQGISVNICIYGTNAILAASKDVLRTYKVECTYQYIQLGFNLWWLPAFIINFCNVQSVDEYYNQEVMITAYGAVTQCVCWVLLSIVYRYYFNITTAHQAFTNVASQSYIALDDADNTDNKTVQETHI